MGSRFPHTSRPSLSYNRYRVFPGGKAAGAWPWPPLPFSVGVRERVELYFYSPFGPSWPVLVWTLILPSVFTLLLSLPCILISKLVSFQTHSTRSSRETCCSLHSVMLSRGDISNDISFKHFSGRAGIHFQRNFEHFWPACVWRQTDIRYIACSFRTTLLIAAHFIIVGSDLHFFL